MHQLRKGGLPGLVYRATEDDLVAQTVWPAGRVMGEKIVKKYIIPKRTRQVGRCRYHRWNLSWRQASRYRCLSKGKNGGWCRHFRAFIDHDVWKNPKHRIFLVTNLGTH